MTDMNSTGVPFFASSNTFFPPSRKRRWRGVAVLVVTWLAVDESTCWRAATAAWNDHTSDMVHVGQTVARLQHVQVAEQPTLGGLEHITPWQAVVPNHIHTGELAQGPESLEGYPET